MREKERERKRKRERKAVQEQGKGIKKRQHGARETRKKSQEWSQLRATEERPKRSFEERERWRMARPNAGRRSDEREEPHVERRTRNGFENTYAVAVVEAGRSWPALIRHLMLEGGVPGPEARRARLSSSHPGPGRLVGPTSISLFPVIAPDSTPRPPPTEGSLLFLRSAIRQIAIDTDDPLFFFSPLSLFFSSSRSLVFSFSLSLPPSSRRSLSRFRPLFLLLNLRQRQKAVLSPWLAG